MRFLHQVAPVGFDCLDADVQKIRDLLLALSLGEQLSDVPRPIAHQATKDQGNTS